MLLILVWCCCLKQCRKQKWHFFWKNPIWIINPYDSYGLPIRINHTDWFVWTIRIGNPYEPYELLIYMSFFFVFFCRIFLFSIFLLLFFFLKFLICQLLFKLFRSVMLFCKTDSTCLTKFVICKPHFFLFYWSKKK